MPVTGGAFESLGPTASVLEPVNDPKHTSYEDEEGSGGEHEAQNLEVARPFAGLASTVLYDEDHEKEHEFDCGLDEERDFDAKFAGFHL